MALRTLAQNYTDYELTHSLFNANKEEICASVGPYDDYDRPPYSGKLQTWYGCGADDATVYSLAASPEGRECVVVLNARVSEEADREAIQHLVDTFEVDCELVTSEPQSTSSAPATASPETSATPSGGEDGDRNRNRAYDSPASSPASPGYCEPGERYVEPNGPGDGDGDGCAGEE